MASRTLWSSASAAVVLLAFGTSTHALTTIAVEKCRATKIKTQGKTVAGLLGCYAKGAAASAAVDPDCVANASGKMETAFTKLDGTGSCQLSGDGSARVSDTENYALGVDAAIGHAGKCDAAKIKSVGKYVAALAGCYAKAAGKSGTVDGTCAVKARQKLESALGKAASKPPCTNGGNQFTTLWTAARAFADAQTCLLGPPNSLGCAFQDNLDGTVTDLATGLMWEKKTTTPGSSENHADPHDVDNFYTYSATGTAPDGTVFTEFLARLNTPPCFAGHCDWRLPRVNRYGDPAELETLVDVGSCAWDLSSACIFPALGPTRVSGYSSDTPGGGPEVVSICSFIVGELKSYPKLKSLPARAVRSTP